MRTTPQNESSLFISPSSTAPYRCLVMTGLTKAKAEVKLEQSGQHDEQRAARVRPVLYCFTIDKIRYQ